jgi:hypothetical protein
MLLAGSKLDNAKELKKVVYFSNAVLAPLVSAIKGTAAGEKNDAAMKEIVETLTKAKVEADKEAKAVTKALTGDSADTDDLTADTDLASVDVTEPSDAAAEAADGDVATALADGEVQPTSPTQAEQAKVEVEVSEGEVAEVEGSARGQKEIFIGDEDIEKQDRIEIYKTYFIYCMTGDVVQLPMGGTIVLERDQSEFARLSQLGDLLGLNQMDVYHVQAGMAEDAFKSQAEALAPGGNLSPDGAEQLNKMAEKMGISQETKEKIIRGVTNKRILGNMQSMKNQGELTLTKVRSSCLLLVAPPPAGTCVGSLRADHLAGNARPM